MTLKMTVLMMIVATLFGQEIIGQETIEFGDLKDENGDKYIPIIVQAKAPSDIFTYTEMLVSLKGGMVLRMKSNDLLYYQSGKLVVPKQYVEKLNRYHKVGEKLQFDRNVPYLVYSSVDTTNSIMIQAIINFK